MRRLNIYRESLNNHEEEKNFPNMIIDHDRQMIVNNILGQTFCTGNKSASKQLLLVKAKVKAF